ncbi:MAG: diphosphate--fructose-6-phosphate 1-phosphotransferase, partial [Porphyromonas sp.]|nr:diphosphate--fructose-6-phosphate 1-phosphotransferase [Porphyromonas sp.]
MKKSALQVARASYMPKMPKALQGQVVAVEGNATQSVADQDAIKNLFPNTYGLPLIEFQPATEKREYAPIHTGVILSGGQAPGG